MSPTLLDAVRGLLERTYRMESGLPGDLGRFVIGDRGYRELFGVGPAGAIDGPASGAGSGARTLVRETPEGLRACVYFPDALIGTLERWPPWRGLGVENIDAFATFVEELDHLLVIAERLGQRRPVSLFELELHANVSKHLVATRFLAGAAGRLSAEERLWLRRALFDAGEWSDPDPAVRQRYRDAARWAVRLLEALPLQPTAGRLETLRRFHDASASSKLRLIERLAA